jgi:hypothetical protein
MTRRCPAVRHSHSQGQILLERALFCVGCEIIFTGTPRCPRCGSGEAVWPLADWLHSTRSPTLAPRAQPAVDEFPTPHQQQTRPAA